MHTLFLQEDEEKWLAEGPSGVKTNVLIFRCSTLTSQPPNLPAEALHMSYKTLHSETKLLNALLTSHGFVEVTKNMIDSFLLSVWALYFAWEARSNETLFCLESCHILRNAFSPYS